MTHEEIAENIVREFLGLEDWAKIPSTFSELVASIKCALDNKNKHSEI